MVDVPVRSRAIEVAYFGNDFPRDDLQSLFRRIHQHSKDKHHQHLAHFINEATFVVKDEVRQLPADLKQLIPPFDTILSWVENTELREGLICGAVDGALLVVAQLAVYTGYFENHGERSTADASLAGLGIGLLAATAVALSSTVADLPLAGADAVRVAFRMGIHVQRVSENLQARDVSQSPDAWAYVVNNVDHSAVQEELDAIHVREETPNTGKIFVSAISRTSVTISGPSARLKTLFNKSEFFRAAKAIPLPVYGGLCHAPHVYGPQDTQSIVYGSSLKSLNSNSRPVMPLYSTSTGVPYQVETAAELFTQVVSELLTRAISWDRVVLGIVEHVSSSAASQAVLSCFGNSLPLNDLITALKGNMPQLNVSINDLMPWPSLVKPRDNTPRTTAQSKLAIVGMSCRLPGGATDTEAFWKILEQGLDVSRQIPPDRFDIATHFDPTGKDLNKSMTQYGCFIDEPGMFDAPFFNISPREAQILDPQMRLTLVTAYEALERSGYVGNRTPSTKLERIGTYYGQAADDYREVNQGQEVSAYYIPGGCRAFGPGRVNYFFKFSGPSYNIDTACSSGLAAIEVACQALWNGSVDTVVTGGVNVLTNPDGFAGLCGGHFLTTGHNACKTWDATADGYCRADGIGSLVIKRLEDAEADNDNILGVILGAATNHSATAVSITHPHAGHQADLARTVLRQSGLDPLDVSYIELHGTGTQAGDYEELKGVMDVYAPLTKRRTKDQPLHIGAVKANVGHSESAAGTTSLLKVLLMLQKNVIPPHIGIKTSINPRFPTDFDKRNLHIAFENTPWTSAGRKRHAVVNSFGAAGGNTTMVLEEASVRQHTECDPRQTQVIAVSAKTKASLAKNIERLIAYIDACPDTNLADLAYTTTARRYHHTHRLAIVATDVARLRTQLAGRLEKTDLIRPVGKSGPPPVAFAFTGQGASYRSMSLELYRDVHAFREDVEHLDRLAQGQGFPSFIPALNGSYAKDHAHSPIIAQLAQVCTEIALAKHWSRLGVKPDVVIGHSLGEYAALQVAGVLSASDAVFLVGRRAQMLEAKCRSGSHTMMAVRASTAQIADCSGGKPYVVSCMNTHTDTVLSGTGEQMNEVAGLLKAAGYHTVKLDVDFAFHSEQTDPILEDFEAIASTGVVFHEPKMPVISPLLGKVVFDGKTLNANYLRRGIRESVDFLSALENARKIASISDETVWIEIGPHPVCTNFIKSSLPSTMLAVPSMRRGDDMWKTLAESMAALHLAGVEVDWHEFHGPFESRLRLLDLPTYAFSDKNYWLPYTGDWCLTKGNTFYKTDTKVAEHKATNPLAHELQTSTVQQLLEDSFDGTVGKVVMQSNLMQKDFLAAANGHRMNNCGVVTSSIHADIAYTLGAHLYRKWSPKSKDVPMDIANLVVSKGLVAHTDQKIPQMIQVTASTADCSSGVVDLTWQNVDNDGKLHEPFATANIFYGDVSEWLSSWSPMAHLVHGRIETLERLAAEGVASRFSHKMAYTLFASKLVDYADKYRGMRTVVMHELEAFADVQLSTSETASGVWTVPPYFIDSVAHLAGFVMNCSDTMDTENNFCVTPGWNSMRFARPLIPGAKYRSYVKMIPTTLDNPTIYLGDVYILQDSVVVGMVSGIKFCRYPRVLLGRFFSPPETVATMVGTSKPAAATQTSGAVPAQAVPKLAAAKPTVEQHQALARHGPLHTNHATAQPAPPKAAKTATAKPIPATALAPTGETTTVAVKALELIANEGGMEMSDLAADVSFADLGIDSLMSLVITEKLRTALGVKVSGSLFLDYPTIGDLQSWLEEYHS